MRWTSKTLRRLRFLFHRADFEGGMEEEIGFHLEMKTREYVAAGLPPEEARRAALRSFGNVPLLKEDSREVWGWRWLEDLFQDLRFGARLLARTPGFTLVVAVTLALGIGANSTIFSWINSTLLNPVPGLAHTREVVSLTRGGTAENPNLFSYPDYMDLRERNQSFSGLVGFAIYPMNLTDIGKPERILGTLASANYFDVLGARPMLGRGFLPEDDQEPSAAPVAVISYRLWQSYFGADDSVIGRTIKINQHAYTIIGVTPVTFQGSQTGLPSDVWIPSMMQQQLIPGGDLLHQRNAPWFMLQGRLRRGLSRQQAQQEMNLLMHQIVQQYPDSHKGPNDVTLYPLWRAPYGANAYFYSLLLMLMAIAGVVLLLTCANIANLLLVRSVAREREIAIRLSIGATRWRLVRQLLMESLLLALTGGSIAVVLTFWTAQAFAKFIPPLGVPLSLSAHVDRTVFLTTLLLSALAGVIFGTLPALRSSHLTPARVLKGDTGRGSGGVHKARLTKGLVVTQIALSLLLLICAGLFIRSFRKAQQFDPGFNPDHVLLASLDLFPAGYGESAGIELDRQLLARLEMMPGVQSATLADWVPLGVAISSTTIKPEGYVPRPQESMEIREAIVGPNYLRTMQIPLLAGREITPEDTERTQPVAVVNQALVDRYWPHQEAIGKRLYADGKWFSVIGIARNSNYGNLNEIPEPFLYAPVFQDYYPFTIIHVRVSGDPLAFSPTVEKVVHELNPNLPVFDVTTLKSHVQIASTGERIAGTFVGAFGLVALVLAAVGIYGVIAYTTRQRTHEIGVRMALGAKRSDVFRLVLSQGLRLTLIGLAVGLALSLAATRLLRRELFGVTTTDVPTFVGVAALLCIVALTACYVPARRATRVRPMAALRYE
jgi:predicted permease